MDTQCYSVASRTIDTLLAWIKSGEIAIPEIQRPFVWDATKVCNLLDSLYQGYPVGYLIVWRNPKIKLKDGSSSSDRRILIDGQQRVTALMAAILGHEVLTKDYATMRIRIAFHPDKQQFKVWNAAIAKDPSWIDDVSKVFVPGSSQIELTENFTENNPGADRRKISLIIEKLRNIIHNPVGVIELKHDLTIDIVTEIFVRVNSSGVSLSPADFAMSKIAVHENFGGDLLRKAIDYFCHLSVAPEFLLHLEKKDKVFVNSEFFPKMRWLKNVKDDLYDPTYTDMLRVSFTSEFSRGKLQDLVALLSGRNFDTQQYEEAIIEESFTRLKRGILAFMDKTYFNSITMILRSAGFLTNSLISSHNAINFAFILYLRGRREDLPATEIERLVRCWYAMSILTSRYSGSIETTFDDDIRMIDIQGVQTYAESVIENELPPTFWTGILPQQLMETSSASSPYFIAYQAAQAQLGDKGFLSAEIMVRNLLLNRGDKHHIFPRKYLQTKGVKPSRYNQIANFVIAQSEINIAISDKAPERYFCELTEQCNGGKQYYGGITDRKKLLTNFAENCIPESMLDSAQPSFEDFLAERRQLMALKIKKWFESLSRSPHE